MKPSTLAARMPNTRITLQQEGTATRFTLEVDTTSTPLPIQELADILPTACAVSFTTDDVSNWLKKVDGAFRPTQAGWSTEITYNVRCAAPTQVGNTARGPTSQKQKATRPMLPEMVRIYPAMGDLQDSHRSPGIRNCH